MLVLDYIIHFFHHLLVTFVIRKHGNVLFMEIDKKINKQQGKREKSVKKKNCHNFPLFKRFAWEKKFLFFAQHIKIIFCDVKEQKKRRKEGKDTLTSNQIRNNKIYIKQQRTLFIGFVFFLFCLVSTMGGKDLKRRMKLICFES